MSEWVSDKVTYWAVGWTAKNLSPSRSPTQNLWCLDPSTTALKFFQILQRFPNTTDFSKFGGRGVNHNQLLQNSASPQKQVSTRVKKGLSSSIYFISIFTGHMSGLQDTWRYRLEILDHNEALVWMQGAENGYSWQWFSLEQGVAFRDISVTIEIYTGFKGPLGLRNVAYQK